MSEDPSGELRFNALRQQIQRHPGTLASKSWDALGHMHAVHLINHRELANLIHTVERNVNGAGFMMVGNAAPEASQEAMFRELLRRLHNYVASAGTLVDHTRILTNNYEGTPTHAEYRMRLKRAMEDDVLTFVKQLRNYFLHVGVPSIGFHMKFSQADGMSILVYVSRKSALDYKGWTEPARRFLEESNERISLGGVIEDYGRVIEALYDWLYDQFDGLHGAEIAEANVLIEMLNAHRW